MLNIVSPIRFIPNVIFVIFTFTIIHMLRVVLCSYNKQLLHEMQQVSTVIYLFDLLLCYVIHEKIIENKTYLHFFFFFIIM